MLKIDYDQVYDNLSFLFERFDWQYTKETCKHYSKGPEDKNLLIQKVFDGTDGRIKVPLDTADEVKRNNIRDYLSNYFYSSFEVNPVYVEASNYFKEELKAGEVETIIYGLEYKEGRAKKIQEMLTYWFDEVGNSMRFLSYDHTGKISSDKEELKPFKGQKITKFLNNYSNYVLIRNTYYRNLEEKEKELVVKYLRNNVLGGIDLVEAIGRSTEYLVLSIRPEDFFTMSYGKNWRSCLNPSDGGYNSAALGYSTGEDSLLAFTVNKEEWDDYKEDADKALCPKLWRQVMYITDKMSAEDKTDGKWYRTEGIISQKGYPRQNQFNDESAQVFLIKALDWEKTAFRHPMTCCEAYPYNDIDYGYVDCFQGWDNFRFNEIVVVNKKVETLQQYKVVLSAVGIGVCLSCGSENHHFSEERCLCDCCNEPWGYCELCDERIQYSDDGDWYMDRYGDEHTICSNCRENCCVYSEVEMNNILSDESVEIVTSFVFNNGQWEPRYTDFAFEDNAAYCEVLDCHIHEDNCYYNDDVKDYVPTDIPLGDLYPETLEDDETED